MSNSGNPDQLDLRGVDFDTVYRDGRFDGQLATERVPWDIGGPQPAVEEFERAGRIAGDVVDIGCGLGGNAIFLAAAGHRVTGLDASEVGLVQARKHAEDAGVEVTFTVADATTLDGYDGRFDTVVSSALYHCLDPDQRRAHAAALHRVTRPGARLNLLSFARPEGVEDAPPLLVTADDLRTTLGGAGWDITELRMDLYTMAAVPETVVAAMRQAGMAVETDAEGTQRVPMWVLHADRA